MVEYSPKPSQTRKKPPLTMTFKIRYLIHCRLTQSTLFLTTEGQESKKLKHTAKTCLPLVFASSLPSQKRWKLMCKSHGVACTWVLPFNRNILNRRSVVELEAKAYGLCFYVSPPPPPLKIIYIYIKGGSTSNTNLNETSKYSSFILANYMSTRICQLLASQLHFREDKAKSAQNLSYKAL